MSLTPLPLRTRLCDLLAIRYPVIQAPMAGGWTTPDLVSEVSNAGGLGMLAGLSGEQLPKNRLLLGRRVVAVFLGVVALISAFFYPVWTGMQTPFWFWHIHVWVPSWV